MRETITKAMRNSRVDACIRQSTDHDPQTQWHRERRLFQGRNPE